jgi:hypothetical protein
MSSSMYPLYISQSSPSKASPIFFLLCHGGADGRGVCCKLSGKKACQKLSHDATSESDGIIRQWRLEIGDRRGKLGSKVGDG